MSKSATAQAGQGRLQFGAFGGVFTPCILTILGVIMFLRANFVVGQAGILGAVLILVISKSITTLTALSTSAVATNMRVKGGGAYYLISRVLGPEFGGAIGLVLFLAQGLSVPFYVLGFSEALVQSIPALKPHFAMVTLGTAGALFVVVYVGASWAIRIQYFIMAILALAVGSFLVGAALKFDSARFIDNLWPAYTAVNPDDPSAGTYSFWAIFAIYFPAVTGIMAGINMSGDLKEPARAIPKGTLAAIGVGFLVYLTEMALCGGAFARDDLVNRPYLLLTENALFAGGALVAAGMFSATLSSALGSFMGSPRVMQAVARDRILGFLTVFAKGAAKTDEPRRGVILCAVMTFAVLVWALRMPEGGAFDIVAQTITMFFLYTYGMLNVAAFIEAVGANPSFRPTFRLFHWATALAGGLGCVGVAFVISAPAAVAAIIVLALLVWHIKRRELRAAFGDARRGFVYKRVRDNLLRLSEMKEDPKNWRPTSLVFSGNPETREHLIQFAQWFEAGRGIVFLANILRGSLEEYGTRREAAGRQLREFCRERGLHAFPVVVVDDDLDHAMAGLMQTVQLGPIRPNIAVFGWSGQDDHVTSAVRQLRVAASMNMSLLMLRKSGRQWERKHKRIDIWWRGMKNGGLMMLLAHLMVTNWSWRSARIRVVRTVDSDDGREPAQADLEKLISEARVSAEARVIVSQQPFTEVLQEESSDADCVFLGFELPEEGQEIEWYKRYQPMLCEEPAMVFVCAVGGEDATA